MKVKKRGGNSAVVKKSKYKVCLFVVCKKNFYYFVMKLRHDPCGSF